MESSSNLEYSSRKAIVENEQALFEARQEMETLRQKAGKGEIVAGEVGKVKKLLALIDRLLEKRKSIR